MPNRFDTTIENINISNGQLSWSAPFLQIFTLSYKPNHIITVWPNAQTIISNGTPLEVHSDDMRASLVLDANTNLTLDRFQWVAEGLRIAILNQNEYHIENAAVAVRRTPGRANAYDLSLQLSNLTLPEQATQVLDPNAHLGLNLTASFGVTAQFTSPITLSGSQPPELTEISINTGRIDWGPTSMALDGTLTRDYADFGAGTLTGSVEHWRTAFAVLVNAGVVQPGWEGAFSALEDGNGVLQIPLEFQNGRIQFGPFDLGPAPQF